MLRIAVPNKGSLSEPASQMLREAGYRQRRDSRELVLADPANDAEFFFLRPRDIAVYVGEGTVDAGITGRDLLLDSGSTATEHLPLGFAGSTFRYAAPQGTLTDVRDVAGQRVATSYPVLVAAHLAAQGVEPAAIVRLDGAVETAIKLGVADVIADVVETGSTLRAAGPGGLRRADPAVRGGPRAPRGRRAAGRARRADPPAAGRPHGPAVRAHGLRRAGGRRRAGRRDHPGPGVADGVAAAQQRVGGRPGDGAADRTNRVMDDLYEVGARAILVTTIHACRI